MAEIHGERPRAKTMVQLDPDNAYARLGVSPLLPTAEIKEVINRERKEEMRRRRTRGEQRFGEEEAEMTRLQAIEDEIGTPRARARYDRLNPQNVLLTVQPGPGDSCLDPANRAGLATAWLVEELGREGPLPSPESLALWAPRGLDPELVAFLAAFASTGDRGAAADGLDAPPNLDDLRRIAPAPASPNGSPASREPAADGSTMAQITGGPSDG
jgi:hypothetical protein